MVDATRSTSRRQEPGPDLIRGRIREDGSEVNSRGFKPKPERTRADQACPGLPRTATCAPNGSALGVDPHAGWCGKGRLKAVPYPMCARHDA
jgi:hypothetical protein